MNELRDRTICFTISFISCLYMFRAHVLIIRRSKLYYTASGIITPVGGRPVHRLRDSTTEKENRKPKSKKSKRAVSSEWKRNKTKLLRNTGHAYRNYKRGTKIYERKIRPPCMAT
jgi:hypothetical protein